MNVLAQRARDNSRTPMQWTAGTNAGFTSGTAWLELPENYTSINAEAEETDPDSILNYYRELVKLRQEHPVIAEGTIRFLETGNDDVLAYEREGCGEHLVVICNFSREERTVKGLEFQGEMLIGNWKGSHKMLKPYEAVVLSVK